MNNFKIKAAGQVIVLKPFIIKNGKKVYRADGRPFRFVIHPSAVAANDDSWGNHDE